MQSDLGVANPDGVTVYDAGGAEEVGGEGMRRYEEDKQCELSEPKGLKHGASLRRRLYSLRT